MTGPIDNIVVVLNAVLDRQARIGAVIGADDLTSGPGEFSNWSHGVRAALQEHYAKADTLGHLSVWLPQENHTTSRSAIPSSPDR